MQLTGTQAEKLLRALVPAVAPEGPAASAMAGLTLRPPSASFQRTASRQSAGAGSGARPGSSLSASSAPGGAVSLDVVEAFTSQPASGSGDAGGDGICSIDADSDAGGAGGAGGATTVFIVSAVDPRIDICEKTRQAVGAGGHARAGTLRHTFCGGDGGGSGGGGGSSPRRASTASTATAALLAITGGTAAAIGGGGLRPTDIQCPEGKE
jgi:hypothetical protein